MKKKVLAVLLGGCMVAGLVAGCGSKDDGKATDGELAADHYWYRADHLRIDRYPEERERGKIVKTE